ncbi:hypothetical protein C4578_03500 [Candidatus Microgenomates bacterium]|jgi:hypothetical protein|nr:MAG: hypothetical protein C4578_03500 [Candidatus Microgenomates bacterium]
MPELPEKEILNQLFKEESETYPVKIEEEPELSPELEPAIKKVEKEIYLSQPITDDNNQPLVSPPAPQHPTIVLPISHTQYARGLTQKVTESIRWLTEWCLRVIKIFGTRAEFRKEEN